MFLIKEERMQLFVLIEGSEEIPSIFAPFETSYMRKVMYGNFEAMVFTQLFETIRYKIGEHRVKVFFDTILDPIPFEPGFYIHVASSGKTVNALLNGTRKIPLKDGQLNMFYLTEKPNLAPISTGDYCFFHIGFGIEVLREIMNRLPKNLHTEKLSELFLSVENAAGSTGGLINRKPVELNPYLAGLIGDIMAMKITNTKAQKCYLDKKVQQFIEHFLAQYISKDALKLLTLTDEDINTIDSIKGYISRNVHKPVSLWLLSKKTAIPPGRLNSSFRQFYGISVNEYIHNCRMGKAAMLLTRTSSPVQMIASLTGYSNCKTFIKHFTSFYGCAPSAFR